MVKVSLALSQPQKYGSQARTKFEEVSDMSADRRKAFIRNIAEVPWLEFPNHFGGAL
jgi:hypothetical protein